LPELVEGTGASPNQLLLRKLGDGASEADLLDGYPRLTGDDLRAAVVYYRQ